MKTQLFTTWLAALPVVAVLFFTSCLNGDGENSQTFVSEPLVVTGGTSTTAVVSLYGTFYAPQLDTQFYEEGQCLLANFKINFDEQTSSTYTITEMTAHQPLNSNLVTASPDSVVAGYDKVVSGVQLYVSSSSGALLLKNHLFLLAFHAADASEKYVYQMVWIDGDRFTQNGNPTLYLSARVDPNGTLPQSGYVPFAVDMSEFIAKCKTNGNVETNSNGVSTLKFNIRYRMADTAYEEPVFSAPVSYTLTFGAES